MLREKRQRMYAECDDEAQAGDAMDVEARRVHALVAEFKQVQLAHIGQAREVATFSQDKFCTESEIAQTMARFNQATEDQRKDKFCIQPKLAAGVAALNNAEPVHTGKQGKARGTHKTRRGPFSTSREGIEETIMQRKNRKNDFKQRLQRKNKKVLHSINGSSGYGCVQPWRAEVEGCNANGL